ncbi:hypothetical protein JHK84_027908 [Glycine max]|nr:hypothetical protein JHK86_027791 [Glycine max]KAG5151436.1 hypothetical protein JHK84_027908 [Glycine max]
MDDLERLKKIRNHHGLRHYWGLRVRGQHTKCTGHRGKTVGVSKKVGSAVVFRDLDADDFHHPLDKQVHPIWRLFIASLLPNSFTTKEKIMHAKAVMAQLGLTMCKDNIIGGPLVRGVGFWREEEKG